MIYWGYPAVTAADRLKRALVLDPTKIHFDLPAAYDRLAREIPPDKLRLSIYDGRPAYRFSAGGDESLVYADNGQVQSEFPPELTLRIAASWTGQPVAFAKTEINAEEDQWTVSGQFRALRPLMKYSWPDGEQVYVSTVTGEVVQYTTRSSRIFAHLGPIPHWLYYTPLRRNVTLWSRIVIWLAGIGTFTAILGLVVGFWMYSPTRRYSIQGVQTSIPYTGPKRWHTIAGLFFGIVACTWAFSGMLSMDPFPQAASSDEVDARVAHALRGGPILPALFADRPSREVLAKLGSDFAVAELEYTSMAGEPVYLASGPLGQTRIVPVRGEPLAALDRNLLLRVIRSAVQPFGLAEVRTVTKYEAYYIDRHHQRPLPVLSSG